MEVDVIINSRKNDVTSCDLFYFYLLCFWIREEKSYRRISNEMANERKIREKLYIYWQVFKFMEKQRRQIEPSNSDGQPAD